jgi:iron-sulfur cluster assembly 2
MLAPRAAPRAAARIPLSAGLPAAPVRKTALRPFSASASPSAHRRLAVTAPAAAKIAALPRQDWVRHPERAALRLKVEGGGCSGYTYNFSVDDTLDAGALAEAVAEARADDAKAKSGADAQAATGRGLRGTSDVLFTIPGSDARLVVDQGSLDHVAGATVDWREELIRSAFVVAENPNAELSCGCGTSFASTAADDATSSVDEIDTFDDLGFDFRVLGGAAQGEARPHL